MNSKLYLRFWLSFLFSLLCVLSFSINLYKFNSLKTKKEFLKQNVKSDSLFVLSELNKKLKFLINSIDEIKQKESMPSNHPFSKLITLQKNKIEKTYLNLSSEVKITENEIQKIVDAILASSTSSKKLKIQFKKIKHKGNSHIVLIHLSDKGVQDIAFFKNKKSFFKIPPLKRTNIHFTTVTSKNDFIFYETKLKKYRRAQVLESFVKNNKTSNSKYISIKAKKKSPAQIYYLHKWTNTNLYLISYLKNSTGISQFVFLPTVKYKWTLVLIFILFCISLFLFWFYLSSLISAYSFLKLALTSFSEGEKLPLSPPSKNFLLYFYNNRISFLNKKEDKKLEEKTEDKSFQSLIRTEVKKLKSRYPNMEVTENFHTNVKIFNSDRRFKALIHELLLNALEAMGTLEKQKIVLTLKEEKDNLVFCVRDYGEEDFDIKKALQMYHSTKFQVGVGLNIVQSLVKANGGKLDLKYLKKELGTQATVYLPLKCFLKG